MCLYDSGIHRTSSEGGEMALWFHALSVVYHTAPAVCSTPSDTLTTHPGMTLSVTLNHV